ncbi:hypothetical protein CK203_036717 [Vitis vinifera]|uniref:Reverse transcriptase domain-containing protein n=1 Tax=Vitis vinifera TaxID=29760 RepID=A0A438I0L3_VITVI|nr:hypothetical protein CK203_036717 [Vitis vinifera]
MDIGSLADCFGYNPFKWGLIPFRFENMWLQHPSFKECFSSWWRDFEGNGWEGHRDKAPGPDGFTIAVFQNFWDVIKEDLAIREERVVFKIDFEKAYDHVNWDFLVHVLEKKGFSPKWRNWMRGCLSSVSYAILVNENAKGWVKTSRGLRQGDPLSSFLFTIVADVLSRMMLRAEERKLQTLKSLLLVFGQISGLKVNLDKSNLIGINLDQNHLSRLALFLDCKAFDWPILYLGLPLRGNPIACGFWDPVIERISRRLDGWQKALTYLLGLQRDFLWSGVGEGKRDHLVSWDVVCKPRVKGGLGFGKISLRYLALLGKWLWRYPRESTTLWHQVILSIYETDSNGWDANTLVRWRWGKNSLLGRFVAGDQPLKSQYPRLFRVVMDKNSLISSILGSARPFSWNFSFRRNLSDSEIEDLECLMRSLDSLSQVPDLSPCFPTKFVWNSQVPCLVSGTQEEESADHLFLHCSLSMGLWHRLFQLAKMDWVPPRSISDMMSINYKGFDASKRGIVLWQNASIALIWVVWWERNASIFEDKARNSKNLWDSVHFLASL